MLTASTGVMQLLSLWIIFLLSTGVSTRKQRSFTDDDGNDDDDDDEAGTWSESVSRARCASRCVSLHGVGAAALLSPPQNNGSLGWCHHHKQCSKCLEPCSDSWKMKKKSNCREMCERVFPKKHWECVTSCEFIQSVLAVKQGSCPPPDRASGFAAACVESCDHDRECSTQKKCCFNNCGHTCQSPKDLYKGAPLKPRKELSFEELSSGELVVHWSSRFNISAEPVVYILQRRWNFGIQPSEDTATSWQLVGQTTEQEVKLSDIRPGRWYQFRVAAVNIHGTRGFTTPSRHIHSSRAVSPASSALLASGVKSSFDKSFKMSLADPSTPPAPTDVRVTNMSFGPGRTVSAKITWRVPEDLDVPVHHYHVTWSWTAIGQASASAASKRRKTVRERQVVLDSMRSNRRYSVEVQAVSFWGQTQLRGPRAALHFSTQRTAGRVPVSGNLDVGTPFYHEGQLRAHVYWQSSKDPSVEFYKVQWVPEHCGQNQTTHMKTIATRENFISLQGLLFSCKYKILWQPISKKSRPLAESISLLTPPCATIQAKSPKPITCPGETAVSPQKLPVKATNLTALFRVHGSNVSAIFSWGSSMTPPQQALIGYQVTWVELVQTNRRNSKKLPHSLISQSQILPPNGNVLVVSGLHPASVYRLEVKAITAEGEGPATRRTFQTPGYKITPKQRLKLRKHHHDNPVPEKN